ncbi:MAG: M1 family metallopeptidase, partial [Candidatus Zixiibacteriota bacterium]
MKTASFLALILIFTVFFLTTPTFSESIFDESLDPDTLKPWQIHEILAASKAGELSRARAFAAEAARTTSFLDQTTYNVGFHRIELEIDIPSEMIYGNVLVQGNSTVDGLDAVELDLYSNLTVDSVYTPGGALNYSHGGNKLLVELGGIYNVDENFAFTVRYHGHPVGSGLDGFSFDYRYDVPVVTTLSEPMSARTWWPCKDRPDDKADSLDIIVTCDTAYFCASNGTLIDTTRNGDGTWTFNYEVRYPITTYLFSLAISNYTIWHNWYYYGDNDSMVVTHHVYPDKYATSLISYNITPFAIQVLADLFGEYPFIEEKYGHANFQWGGAMEHQTVTSMTGSNFGFSEPVIVHELAHQWWGDMITCNNWHDIWLNEGFASYAEALYYEIKDGVNDYHAYMQGMKYVYGGTIYVYDTTNVWNIFSSIVYDKGAWVLHMLRHIVGDATFFDILQTYYDSEYKFKDVTTEQFKNLCETVSGLELDYFYDEWIYGTYYPRYYWTYWSEQDPSDGRYWTFFLLEQTQATFPQVFTMPVDAVFYFNSGIDTLVIFNDLRKNMYLLKTDEMPIDIELDPDEWILSSKQELSWTLNLIPFPLDTGVQFLPYVDSIIARGESGDNVYKVT